VQPWLSLRTQPASQPISDPAQVRALSRQRYGVSLGQVDSDLAALRGSGREGDLGRSLDREARCELSGRLSGRYESDTGRGQ